MNEIQENKLELYRRIEELIRKHEENEAKVKAAAEAIHQKFESSKTSFGPANDLIQFFYILEQQNLSDNDDTRRKARADVLEYIDQFRQEDEDEEEEEEEEENNAADDQQSVDVSQPTPTTASNSIIPSIGAAPSQPAATVPIPSSQVTATTSTEQALPTRTSYLSAVTDPNHIRPETLEVHEELLIEAKKYKSRYENIPPQRKKTLSGPIRDILNKLRRDTLQDLLSVLFGFLSGAPLTVSGQTISISMDTDAERLLCYSLIGTLVLRQLLGGDMNTVKADIFPPLIDRLSRHEQHKEFRTIFLDCLHEKCPYTVPFFPKRQPDMDDVTYLKAIGYGEKIENNVRRLEIETEFLNRMSGFIRLFWKLAAVRIPPFDKDLSFAWRWGSDVLNLPPRPNLSVLLLRIFLDEAGALMIKGFGANFVKFVRTIKSKLNDIAKDTNPSETARLQTAIENVLKLTP